MYSSATEYCSIKSQSDGVITRIIKNFEDPSFNEEQWTQLLKKGDTDSVNLTWNWQRLWWKAFGRGELLLIVAEQNDQPIALAPLFAEHGMIYNLCPKDAIDFVGDISNPVILDSLLNTARNHVTGFLGFQFYFIPETSRTGPLLKEAAARLNLVCYDEQQIASPALDLIKHPELALAATRKKSMLCDENYFKREGGLEVLHLQNGKHILLHLDEFFDQHIRRRQATQYPSSFLSPVHCNYYRHFTEELSSTGWLRFSRINWKGKAIAFHYGLCYRGRYLFGVPSFDIDLSKHSPGMVMMRQLLLAAISEKAMLFDFGIGDEAYKYRFATHINQLHTWGLYSKE